MKFDTKVIPAICLLLLIAAVQNAHAFGRQISIMTYNVENLFDTEHDEGKTDWTYLPLAEKRNNPDVRDYCKNLRNSYYRKDCLNLDWSYKVLKQKILNLASVIKVAANGDSPDILVMEEVENIKVLKMLRDVGLPNEGYQEIVLIEGPDKRGIDIAILSKFPLYHQPVLHNVDLSEADDDHGDDRVPRPTRGILEATFEIGNSKLTVLGNHWPSQSNPDKYRWVAAKRMAEIAGNARYPVVATGDFNTVPSDDPHGINTFILNRSRKQWFFDAEKVFFGDTPGSLQQPHRGTHWYRGEWTSLDRLFFLNGSFDRGCGFRNKDCIRPLWDTYKVVKEDFMLKDITETDDDGNTTVVDRVPQRFDAKTGEGYSDHLPAIIWAEVR